MVSYCKIKRRASTACGVYVLETTFFYDAGMSCVLRFLIIGKLFKEIFRWLRF